MGIDCHMQGTPTENTEKFGSEKFEGEWAFLDSPEDKKHFGFKVEKNK